MRPASLTDLAGFAELEPVYGADAFSRGQLRHLLTRANASCLAAEIDGELVGNAIVVYRKGSAIARLYTLTVAPGHQGKGVGRALLAQAESAAEERSCRRMRLEVRADNMRAHALYLEAGYVARDRLEGYYADGGDALVLVKELHRPQLPPAR